MPTVRATEDRLDSWKAIAIFIDRNERTAKRWEEECGMPVHRVPGRTRGPVYAFRSEIEEWLQTQASSEENVPVPPANDVIKAPVGQSRMRWRGAAIVVAVAVLAVGVALVVPRVIRPSNPERAVVVGAELTAYDRADHAIWRYHFPAPLEPPHSLPDFDPRQNAQIHIADLKGDGRNEVIVSAAHGIEHTGPDGVYCFAADGHLLWHYEPRAEFNFVVRPARGPWKIHALAIVPTESTKTVWAAFTDPMYAPTIVASVDAGGTAQIRYISSGNVNALIGTTNQSGSFVLAGGINNEYRAASLAVLDVRQPVATSPQTPGNPFACTTCPASQPVRFVLLPRSEVNIASGLPYNWVQKLGWRDGRILAETIEQRETAATVPIGELVEFSEDFVPKSISFSAGYKEAHERMNQMGLINHKWSECKEQARPAVARVWDNAQGWREIQVPWVH